MPADLVFGIPAEPFKSSSTKSQDLDVPHAARGSLTSLLLSFRVLSRAFESVLENFNSFLQREKDRYDLGAVTRVFSPGDIVRVRLKCRQRGPTKFQPEFSGPHEVLSVRGVVITLKELSSGRTYVTHHDRLSNPLLHHQSHDQNREVLEILSKNANPTENEQDPE